MYLDLKGNKITDKNIAAVEFIKLNMSMPSGSVFGDESYGYSNLNIDNDESIKSVIDNICSKMNRKDISVSSIKRYNNMVNIELKGIGIDSSIEV